MEGPSLYLAQLQLKPFRKQLVQSVSGNTKIGKERFLNKEVKDIFSWGKHLVFQFDTFAFRVHFLLFGTFEATVDNLPVTGDYKKKAREPRLVLEFSNGHIEMYSCSIKIFETSNLKKTYDFSIDIMSSKWDSRQALQFSLVNPDEEIADVILDQTIFAGVGNIIKNEVLSQTGTNPKQKISSLSQEKLQEIIEKTQKFSRQFYKWRKEFVLRKHLLIYRKALCPICQTKIIREKTGKRQRWSYYCPICQKLT